MREIKFRAQLHEGGWVYGYYVEDDSLPDDIAIINNGKGVQFEVLKHTAGQSTELKDKSGVEIYEGDIVRETMMDDPDEKYEEAQVEAVESRPGYFYPVSAGDSCGCCSNSIMEPEVIGNIYDNPGLLKKA